MTTPPSILARVELETGVPVASMMRHDKRAHVVKARDRAMWLMRKLPMTYEQIGWHFDLDHSSALMGVRREQGRIDSGRANAIPVEISGLGEHKFAYKRFTEVV